MHTCTIEWLAEVDSTQSELKRRWRTQRALSQCTVLATGHQTAGHGRQGRIWISKNNENLCFSLLWRLSPNTPPPAGATLAAALAIDDVLQSHGMLARPKWPNDVLIGNRKICGIVGEYLADTPPALALGIGLNVNSDQAALAQIERPATSMKVETERSYALETVLDEVLQALQLWLPIWEREGFEGLRTAWELRSHSLGQPIRVHRDAEILTGRVAGYGTAGELLLETLPGVIHTIWSGEVVEKK